MTSFADLSEDNIVVQREDHLFIEWLASEVCASTSGSVAPCVVPRPLQLRGPPPRDPRTRARVPVAGLRRTAPRARAFDRRRRTRFKTSRSRAGGSSARSGARTRTASPRARRRPATSSGSASASRRRRSRPRRRRAIYRSPRRRASRGSRSPAARRRGAATATAPCGARGATPARGVWRTRRRAC